MEIQKAKELRDQLQEDILSLIKKFEEDTETHVYLRESRFWANAEKTFA